jgi:hypothetical protein
VKEQVRRVARQTSAAQDKSDTVRQHSAVPQVLHLQRTIGNQVVARMLSVQRFKGGAEDELYNPDEDTFDEDEDLDEEESADWDSPRPTAQVTLADHVRAKQQQLNTAHSAAMQQERSGLGGAMFDEGDLGAFYERHTPQPPAPAPPPQAPPPQAVNAGPQPQAVNAAPQPQAVNAAPQPVPATLPYLVQWPGAKRKCQPGSRIQDTLSGPPRAFINTAPLAGTASIQNHAPTDVLPYGRHELTLVFTPTNPSYAPQTRKIAVSVLPTKDEWMGTILGFADMGGYWMRAAGTAAKFDNKACHVTIFKNSMEDLPEKGPYDSQVFLQALLPCKSASMRGVHCSIEVGDSVFNNAAYFAADHDVSDGKYKHAQAQNWSKPEKEQLAKLLAGKLRTELKDIKQRISKLLNQT